MKTAKQLNKEYELLHAASICTLAAVSHAANYAVAEIYTVLAENRAQEGFNHLSIDYGFHPVARILYSKNLPYDASKLGRAFMYADSKKVFTILKNHGYKIDESTYYNNYMELSW